MQGVDWGGYLTLNLYSSVDWSWLSRPKRILLCQAVEWYVGM